jgi:hypothetical protein
MKNSMFVVLLVCLLPAMLLADTTEVVLYRAILSPTNEVPVVTNANITGEGTMLLKLIRDNDGNLTRAYVDFLVNFHTAEERIFTAMHIHRGGAHVSGPVVLDSVFGERVTVTGDGRIWRQVTVESASGLETVEAILANHAGYYLNLHTTTHGPGIFRGQLEPVELASIKGLEAKVDALTRSLADMQRVINALGVRAGILAPTR